MVLTALLVGAGGFIGTVGRFLVGTWLPPTGEQRFPFATLTVNVLGCALIGLLAGLTTRQTGGPSWLSPGATSFLMVGVLGGFTTFSAFGLETFPLLELGDVLAAGVYVAASVLVGVAAVWLGLRLAQAVS